MELLRNNQSSGLEPTIRVAWVRIDKRKIQRKERRLKLKKLYESCL